MKKSTKKQQPPTQRRALQLKISLDDSPLLIWRRLVLSADMPLPIVHQVFQLAIGWWESHLHDFESKERHFGDLETAEGDDRVEDEIKFTLQDLASKKGDQFKYHYDFGDGWSHTVIIEKEILEPEGPIITCLAGKRACPPEDVGGTDGYRKFLEIIEDPQHEEREEMLLWAGGNFEPDSFDIRGVNLRLTMLKQVLMEVGVIKKK